MAARGAGRGALLWTTGTTRLPIRKGGQSCTPIRGQLPEPIDIPEWAGEGEVRTTAVPFRTTDAAAQIVAIRQGLGIGALPCFVGDADPALARVPGTDLHLYGTLWLLTQGETRKTARVRLFTEFVSRRLAAYAPLLAGLPISRD
ncbi:LysR substrate-binding domain-containing protein [Sphingomonas nostoxanthinifaciens]|uniref:LysR substrate-binding domain-containing protein n=1 Tax=Sphingomonas nostoxanthinifaciens TaxID=2872652 RepID=UPI001CC1D661|nr:LysR substrate-binding domain-containing protein [Sphingomonas nostoxanthinifaciens]